MNIYIFPTTVSIMLSEKSSSSCEKFSTTLLNYFALVHCENCNGFFMLSSQFSKYFIFPYRDLKIAYCVMYLDTEGTSSIFFLFFTEAFTYAKKPYILSHVVACHIQIIGRKEVHKV